MLHRLPRLGRWRRWHGVDNFAGPCVVELFARLVFDGARIVLKPVDVALQELVFTLEPLELDLQGASVLTFLLVGSESVLSEYDVVAETDGEGRGSYGRDSSPAGVNPLVEPNQG
jgi:hypothetical protein